MQETTAEQSGSAAAVLPKTFDPEFNQKSPGDIILVAIDDKPDVGYYFRFALLAEISTFFSTLPPPSPTDLVDGGTALIPLHGIQSGGLYLLLKAIQSIHAPEPFAIGYWYHSENPTTATLQAAVAARLYQMPIVYRLLVESLPVARDRTGYHHYLEFAIWAIGGVEAMLAGAARETLTDDDEDDITTVDPAIVEMCKAHAPIAWLNLLDYHLRYERGVSRFQKKVYVKLSGHLDRSPGHVRVCSESAKLVNDLRERLARPDTVEEVIAVRRGGYGVKCPICAMEVKKWCDPWVSWLEDYCLSYVRLSTKDF